MSKIYIRVDGVNRAQSSLQNASQKVSEARNAVNSLSWQVAGNIKARKNIAGKMSSISSQLSSIEGKLSRIRQTVSSGAARYDQTEQKLEAQWRQQGSSAFDLTEAGPLAAAGAAVAMGTSESLWEKFFHGDVKAEAEGSVWNFVSEDGNGEIKVLHGEAGASITPEYGSYKDDSAIYKKSKDTRQNEDYTYVYDPKTGQYSFPEMTEWAEKQGTIGEVSAAATIGGDIFAAAANKEGKYGSGSVSAKIGTAEAHAGVSGGMYVYDKDGKKKFAPAVEAKIGASASAFTASADGRLNIDPENDLLGVYGKGEVSVGKAEAQASATASLFNEDGSVNLQAHAKASAEAIAAEAEGSAGVTVLGTDIGVNGSVNVGVGAHAEAGIVDGKIKVDVGVSIGLGVSVGFEVDVGGTVDAVCSVAESAWNKFTSWF